MAWTFEGRNCSIRFDSSGSIALSGSARSHACRPISGVKLSSIAEIERRTLAWTIYQDDSPIWRDTIGNMTGLSLVRESHDAIRTVITCWQDGDEVGNVVDVATTLEARMFDTLLAVFSRASLGKIRYSGFAPFWGLGEDPSEIDFLRGRRSYVDREACSLTLSLDEQ